MHRETLHPSALFASGVLLGILIGMSGLVTPLVIMAGIIAGGKILLPLIFRRK